ncbi:FTR1 family protein [uncultured Brevundimonas sp.]|uniref:FTR1 family iron permease n=1 Tax=uncultured Brevundimonas sp. TaxID=213418 RepID=UPI0030EC4B91|tara:strand:+ start:3660 stop:4496 length:837 start_codon:yes stop_codon:yes gene_type:complete
MLAALLIVFREVLEAGLIIGIVLAATAGTPGRLRFIGYGAAGGLAGAGLLALFARQLAGAFAGAGQDVFNAVVLGTAVLMLAWHTVWMARHARALSQEMGALGRSVAVGERAMTALAVVIGVAILREGAEVVLFLFGIVVSGGEAPAAVLLGGVGGIVVGGLLSWLIYRGLLIIPTRRLFGVTNLLLSLLAAGMAGQAAVYLVRAGLVSPFGDQLWDTSAWLPDNGLIGRSLHVLVGYSDRPMGIQLAVYAAVLVTLLVLQRTLAPPTAGSVVVSTAR